MSQRQTSGATEDRSRHYRQRAAQFRELAEDEAVEDLCAKLLDLAASYDETAALLSSDSDPQILRARPVQGEIDYVKLTRDTMVRFPKILAALAK